MVKSSDYEDSSWDCPVTWWILLLSLVLVKLLNNMLQTHSSIRYKNQKACRSVRIWWVLLEIKWDVFSNSFHVPPTSLYRRNLMLAEFGCMISGAILHPFHFSLWKCLPENYQLFKKPTRRYNTYIVKTKWWNLKNSLKILNYIWTPTKPH